MQRVTKYSSFDELKASEKKSQDLAVNIKKHTIFEKFIQHIRTAAKSANANSHK